MWQFLRDLKAIISRRRPCFCGLRTSSKRPSFTLVEMLVAMAITLVMMGAVVSLFANISNSVKNRRATIEMSSQLRHLRNVLQSDLQGATCPGVTWQRPESNHGYIEIIEGPCKEGEASDLVDGIIDPKTFNPEIDHNISTIPSSNLPFSVANWATDAAGLGDADDILMFTTRNEHEPFLGQIPKAYSYGSDAQYCVRPNNNTANTFDKITATDTISSPLAEVIWFAVENPGYTDPNYGDDPTAGHFFGEPGMRTIYRRTLLIAPWLNPYRYVDQKTGVVDTFTYNGETLKAQPGMLRVLPKGIGVDQAIAGLIAFQDRYDISARLEWDANIQHWKIMANTLADLTKRENRFNHFYYRPVAKGAKSVGREFPFALISTGSGYSNGTQNVQFVIDPEASAPVPAAQATANVLNGQVVSYTVTTPGSNYSTRPFAYVNADSLTLATAQVMLNDSQSVVRVSLAPQPLWGTRRGQDVMMTDVLAFDLRVFDPGAPIFASVKTPATNGAAAVLDTVVTPSDVGWRGTAPNGAGGAYFDSDNMGSNGTGAIGTSANRFAFVGQGAYVDLGYGYDKNFTVGPNAPLFPAPKYASAYASSVPPWFFTPRGLMDVYGTNLAPGYAVYDTWSFHYENNGINEDGYWTDGNTWHAYDPTSGKWKTKPPLNNTSLSWHEAVDQGTDGLDNDGFLGPDDIGERETTPPYDKPLRGLQVLIRTYERDSRAIRQVRVNQHFMAE